MPGNRTPDVDAGGTYRHRERLPSRPQRELLELQASWLEPARSRLFRRIGIAHKRRILDIGAGYGIVAGELARRSQGLVVALDILPDSFRKQTNNQPYGPLIGDGAFLPFQGQSFDLVFCQCSLLWMDSPKQVIEEVFRTLEPGGVVIAIEPDYEAMIEFPPEIATRELWLDGIASSGGDPIIGRKLPGWFETQGFDVQVGLLESLQPPVEERFLFLEGLLQEDDQIEQLKRIRQLVQDPRFDGWQTISHLPFFLITAKKGHL